MGKTQAVRKRPGLLLKYVFKSRKVDGGICTWSLEEHGEKEWKTAGKKIFMFYSKYFTKSILDFGL